MVKFSDVYIYYIQTYRNTNIDIDSSKLPYIPPLHIQYRPPLEKLKPWCTTTMYFKCVAYNSSQSHHIGWLQELRVAPQKFRNERTCGRTDEQTILIMYTPGFVKGWYNNNQSVDFMQTFHLFISYMYLKTLKNVKM